MVNAVGLFFRLAPDLRHAVGALKQAAHITFDRFVVEVNVSHLVVRYGERPAVSAVEPIEAKLLLDGEPAALTEKSVEMNRSIGWCDAVL